MVVKIFYYGDNMSRDKDNHDNKNNTKNTVIKECSMPLYGMMWENFFKKTNLVQDSLSKYQSINDFKTSYKNSIKDLNVYYRKDNENNTNFLLDEINKQNVVFDLYSPSKKLIVELKLSVNAITYKDIAYLFYFRDHHLHFLFFLPFQRTSEFEDFFYRRIEHLVTNFNTLLNDMAQKLDFNDVKNRIKIITRYDLPIFPDISMQLEKLEPYLPQPPYKCHYCPDGKIFNDIYSLENHINCIHKKIKELCYYCNIEYSWGSLPTHIKRIHEQKKQQCPFCSRFYCYGTLQLHIRIVHEERKVACDLCGKIVSEGTLNAHMSRIHEKRKKKCLICNKFISSDHYSAHIQNVHEKRTRLCEKCNKLIPFDQFLAHDKRVHKKLKQVCKICNKVLSYGHLSRHMKRKHPELT